MFGAVIDTTNKKVPQLKGDPAENRVYGHRCEKKRKWGKEFSF